MERKVIVNHFPKRIISLVPSQTEFLFDLGLDQEIIGITKFCIHPADKARLITKVGGTKKFNFEIIHALQPDLIIGNKEENYKEGIEELAKNFPVWMSDISNLEEAFDMMFKIGGLVNKEKEASKIVETIDSSLTSLHSNRKGDALYLIWKNPFMSIGGDTFIDKMMDLAGFTNIFSSKKRYPEVTIEEIKDINPANILLSSEPYPFKEKHIQELKEISPSSKILLVDGEMFSWYGSRLKLAASYFKTLQPL